MENNNVRLGVWTNWSRGQILGATLTVKRQDADLIIAFTAFFIAFVGSRFWRIACLTFHRFYSSSEPKGALHHQRQAILRNTSSPESGVWTLGKLSWAWRHEKWSFLRIAPTLVFAFLCAGAFIVAGGFSARISTANSNEVLLDGSGCSFVSGNGDVQLQALITAWKAKIVNNAVNYAQNCYSETSSGMLSCNGYVSQKIPTTVTNTTAPCPFKDGICRGNSSNILLDTGYIDSNDHLGLNFAQEDRIQFRKIMQCAPLVTEGHRVDTSNRTYTEYDYGDTAYIMSNHSIAMLNYTYRAPSLSEQYRRLNNSNPLSNYFIEVAWATFENGSLAPDAEYQPATYMQRSDGDLYIMFLSPNGVLFSEPTNDDWYRGNIPCTKLYNNADEGLRTFYCAEEAASPLACVEQYQVCNGDRSKCGAVSSFGDAWGNSHEVFGITYNDMIRAANGEYISDAVSRFTWFMSVIRMLPSNIGSLVRNLGAQGLASQQNLAPGLQGPIPQNQWQLDVTHWWSTSLTLLQAAFVESARGVADPALNASRNLPFDQAQEQMCWNQKILSTEHASFSLFGLYFTFLTGALVILASCLLEPIIACLYRRRQHKEYSHLEWVTNSTLQLQRLAYECTDKRHWNGCTDDIPVPATGEPLVCLDIKDRDHPRLPHFPAPQYTDHGFLIHPMSEISKIHTESKQSSFHYIDSPQSEFEQIRPTQHGTQRTESSRQGAGAPSDNRLIDRRPSDNRSSNSSQNPRGPSPSSQSSTVMNGSVSN